MADKDIDQVASEFRPIVPGPDQIDPPSCGIYVGGAGNIVTEDNRGVEVVFSNVPVGVFRISPSKIKAPGTTATDMIALYES